MVLIQLTGLVVLAASIVFLAHFFDLVGLLEAAQRWVGGLGPAGAAVFPLLYALCNVLLLPAGFLSISSGLFFGLWWGTLLALAGNVLGAAAAFGIGRAIGRRRIERLLFHRPQLAALDRAIAREGWKIIFLSQVHPLFPTSLIDYLYGATRIRFSTCMLWVALGQLPGLFLYAYIGTLAQLGLRLLGRNDQPGWREYTLWTGGLVLTLGVTFALGRIATRLLREAEKSAP